MGLFDLGNVISRTGFKSHVLHSLRKGKDRIIATMYNLITGEAF